MHMLDSTNPTSGMTPNRYYYRTADPLKRYSDITYRKLSVLAGDFKFLLGRCQIRDIWAVRRPTEAVDSKGTVSQMRPLRRRGSYRWLSIRLGLAGAGSEVGSRAADGHRSHSLAKDGAGPWRPGA